MTRLYEFLISLAIVAVLFVIVGVVLPDRRQVTQSVETNRRQTIVFDVVNSFQRFRDWNAVSARDPAIELKLSGPESGKGARVDYVSKEKGIGSGHWVIADSKPKSRVDYTIESKGWGNNKRSSIILEPTGRNNRNVKITQTYDVDYGWNLIGRYSGLYVGSFTGEDIKIGLARLTHMLAGIPNQDYAQAGNRLEGLEVVTVPAQHVLMVNSGAIKRNDESIQAAIKSNQEWIKRVMDANGLEAAGPVRIVTNELSRENYNFDVVQSVRKTGQEGEAAGDMTVTLQGPVKYELQPEFNAARGKFTGYFPELEAMRSAVRAWSMVRGKEVAGRPFEIYTGGVDAAFTGSGQFEVYWPLK
ncbi:polyketide cyclase [Lysobacter pythonis]|uniref:Polyketide cyclase n=1 Tax=Solilutibacter pythonis TaxID=2483112 RepID=A0A3M2I3L7_9GAMM|nr:SRPBCC family protein [Lysobacter pythonis]RMH93067.1 polyketide cyclase [Lysobacter pythonis]